jgi:hypothetical protein
MTSQEASKKLLKEDQAPMRWESLYAFKSTVYVTFGNHI